MILVSFNHLYSPAILCLWFVALEIAWAVAEEKHNCGFSLNENSAVDVSHGAVLWRPKPPSLSLLFDIVVPVLLSDNTVWWFSEMLQQTRSSLNRGMLLLGLLAVILALNRKLSIALLYKPIIYNKLFFSDTS